MSEKKRNPAADILRCFAFFCVVSVHFFLNNGFYQHKVDGPRMFVMTVMRTFFMICVPLFLMLTGYLMRKKTLSKAYYGKVGKTVLAYLLAGVFCRLFAVFYLQQDLTWKEGIFSFFSFTAAPYAWYIEMYLGLFLLTPFLNLIYNNLPSQNWKKVLLLSFLLLTALPPLVNVYNFQSAEWWLHPATSTTYNKLMPGWWTNFYPITYYFLGCYVGEYGVKIKKRWTLLLMAGTTLVAGTYSYSRSNGAKFVWGIWGNYHSLFTVILTVLVFVFIINRNYEKVSGRFARFLQGVSGLCLGGYLVSWIFDQLFYPMLEERVPLVTDRMLYYVVIVPAVYILSLGLSFVLSKLQGLIEWVWSALAQKIKNRKASE